MKLRILFIALLLSVAPCFAQIDYDSQVKNKATDTTVVGVIGGTLWGGYTDPSGAPLPISHIQTNLSGLNWTGNTPDVVSTISPVTKDNLLIVSVGCWGAIGNGALISDSLGTIYTRVDGSASANGGAGDHIYVAIGTAINSGIDTVTITGAGGCGYNAISVSEFKGPSGILDNIIEHPTTGTSALSYPIVTTTAGDLIYTIVEGQSSGSAFTPGSDSVLIGRWNDTNSNWGQIGIQWKSVTVAGTTNADILAAPQYAGFVTTVAIKGKPGPGPGKNGDYFINATTNTLFGPKVNNEWPLTGTKLGGTNITFNGAVTGTIDGTNTIFTLSNIPTTGTLMLYRNGLLQTIGIHYTITTNTITFQPTFQPQLGDTLTALYQY